MGPENVEKWVLAKELSKLLNGKYDMAAVKINAIDLSRWPDGKEGPKNVNKINEKWGYSFEN